MKLLSTIVASVLLAKKYNTFRIDMFERHCSPHEGLFLMIIRCLLITLAILNFIVVPATCREHDRFRNAKTMDLGATRYEDMSSTRQIMNKKLPRQDLVDLLHEGRFFQDIFSEHLEPLKVQFGHVCENPDEWEQRFERKDLKNNKHQGKVRWGNKNEEYGEHYWDLNH